MLTEQGLGSARVAFDEPATVEELRANELPDAESVGGVNVFREIRNVKTPDELTLLRHAALVNETALRTVANILDVGVTRARAPSHLPRVDGGAGRLTAAT